MCFCEISKITNSVFCYILPSQSQNANIIFFKCINVEYPRNPHSSEEGAALQCLAPQET